MDLGVTQNDDFFSSATLLSPEEINALLNPSDITLPDQPSAIQVLLNQGAEILAQKQPSVFEDLYRTWHTYLTQKNTKIITLTEALISGNLGTNAIICPFEINKTETGFIAFDWTTAYILIDGMLGGINGLSIEKRQEQSYSAIEKNLLLPLLHTLIKTLAETLSTPLMPLPLTTFIPALVTDEKRLVLSVRTPATVGKIMVSLPTTLVPQKISQPLFYDHTDLLTRIPLVTEAVLNVRPMTLKEIDEWTIGTTLSLPPIPDVTLVTGTHPLAKGHLNTQNSFRRLEIQEEQ